MGEVLEIEGVEDTEGEDVESTVVVVSEVAEVEGTEGEAAEGTGRSSVTSSGNCQWV